MPSFLCFRQYFRYAQGITNVDNVLMILGVSNKMPRDERFIGTHLMMKGFADAVHAAGGKVRRVVWCSVIFCCWWCWSLSQAFSALNAWEARFPCSLEYCNERIKLSCSCRTRCLATKDLLAPISLMKGFVCCFIF